LSDKRILFAEDLNCKGESNSGITFERSLFFCGLYPKNDGAGLSMN